MEVKTTYCDICVKEINTAELEQTGYIKVAQQWKKEKDSRYFKNYNDVCNTCFNKVCNFIDSLKKVSDG